MRKCLLFSFFIIQYLSLFGHNNDTIYMKNDHIIIGEILVLENNTLTVETDYSDNDFTIEWNEVRSLKTQTEFIVMLTNKYRFQGTIGTDPNNPDYMIFFPKEGSKMFASVLDVVYLKSVDSGILDRVSANIDGGVTLTKASDTRQITMSGKISYLYTRMSAEMYTNTLTNVVQDSIRTKRNNYGMNWRLFFTNSWFVLGASDFLQSDEQNLQLRTTIQVGTGRFLMRNHQMYFSSAAGIALNSEKYLTIEDPKNQSMEWFGELEYNAYGLKNLSTSVKFQYFGSLKESDRRRINFNFDLKYDLPLDFYIGSNITLNYDNKPTNSASELDYVIKSVFGWSF